MYVYMYICKHMCKKCISVNIHVYLYSCIQIYIYVHKYIYIYVYGKNHGQKNRKQKMILSIYQPMNQLDDTFSKP